LGADEQGTPSELFDGALGAANELLDETQRLQDFTVEGRTFDGTYKIVGAEIDKLIRRTNWDYYEARVRFQKTLKAIGVTEALKKAGAVDGDTIEVAGMSFEYTADDNPYAEAARLDGFED
jgi:GTP-binding protein